ncbi:MAG: prepilin-type N-terminal cleavage/methylation domain-containing protein, partial [Opitutales bacterium]|nr:prepilin-type N-terminal cleavage/methylation domain-containing protein [Opitutales bacterium]
MRRAFTLTEMLFALAIASMVMVGACFLMFNMVSVLGRFEEKEPFEVHVNGVEMFLKNILKKSQFASSRDYTVSNTAFAENKNLGKGNPPDSMMGDKSRICFGVLEDVPFFISRRGFSPEKDAWLDFREKEGLYIIWTFAKNENYNAANDDRPIYESLVSPYVASLSYIYIDEDGRWLEEDDMDYVSSASVASNQMPNFIKLVFENGSEKHTRYVSLISNVDGQYEPDDESPSSSRRSSSAGGEGGGEGGRGGGGGSNA